MPAQSGIPLIHRFTNAQLFHVKQVFYLAEQLLSVQRLSGSNALPIEGEGIAELVCKLDRACLLLCIALLDHTLRGDHFESVVLSFLAVLGIDESPGGVFRGPLTYCYDLIRVGSGQPLELMRDQ